MVLNIIRTTFIYHFFAQNYMRNKILNFVYYSWIIQYKIWDNKASKFNLFVVSMCEHRGRTKFIFILPNNLDIYCIASTSFIKYYKRIFIYETRKVVDTVSLGFISEYTRIIYKLEYLDKYIVQVNTMYAQYSFNADGWKR